MPVSVEWVDEVSESDFADLIKIYADCPAALREDLSPIEKINDWLHAVLANNKLVVARFNGRLLGSVLLQQINEQWQLSCLCVRKVTRRRGVGRRVIEVLQQQSRAQQQVLVANIPVDDSVAMAFLQALNFAAIHSTCWRYCEE